MIGALDQKIRIEAQVSIDDGAGGRETAWQPLALDPEPFARVELMSGDEVSRGDARQARQRARFTLRARDDLKAADRIIWSGLVWDIKSVGRPVARAMYQKVEAVSGEVSA
ncbi:MAG: head-tail adaptor protein [Pseudomonadota bacterium]